MAMSCKWVKVQYWVNYPFNSNAHTQILPCPKAWKVYFSPFFAVDLGGHLYFEFFADDIGSYSTRREPK